MSCRIEDYGLIGDCETAALVGRDGSIDWLCWPAFDCDACFAALLGNNKHGRWQIAPAEAIIKTSRRYRDNTLILETRFETASGVVELIDFMPPRGKASDVVRLVRGVKGCVKLQMELIIRFGLGTDIPWVKKSEDGSALLAIAGQDMIVLRSPVQTRGQNMTTVAEFTVGEGETVPFVMTYGPSHLPVPGPIDPAQALQDTEAFWTEWSNRCTYEGFARNLVLRSLITLKALTFAPTGGIVAAPTTSLPEKRRPAQLGLPLLLAAGRDLHAAGADELGLYRGSARLAQLAVARRRGIAGQHADHVRHHGPAAASGMGSALAARL